MSCVLLPLHAWISKRQWYVHFFFPCIIRFWILKYTHASTSRASNTIHYEFFGKNIKRLLFVIICLSWKIITETRYSITAKSIAGLFDPLLGSRYDIPRTCTIAISQGSMYWRNTNKSNFNGTESLLSKHRVLFSYVIGNRTLPHMLHEWTRCCLGRNVLVCTKIRNPTTLVI